MMRKKIVSLCMALVLCLSLLPATVLAADGDTVYVGGVALTCSTGSPAYATTDTSGNVSSDGSESNYNIKWDGSTLTLNGAKIKGADSSESLSATVGIYAFNSSGDVSLNIALKGVNEIFESSNGIWVYSSSSSTNAGNATLTIEGEGSLNASGGTNGIQVQSNSGNAALTIRNADVTAENSIYSGDGVTVRAGSSSSASLSVDGGSLTATGTGVGSGINFLFGSGVSGSGMPSLTVSGNAMVKASGGEGGISDNSSADIQIGVGDNSSGGIVFDGNKGTVYGSVTLQEDLTIGEGESLTLDDGANLDAGGHNVIVDGGTVDDSIKTSLGESVKYPPTITTNSLPGGTVGTDYSQPLTADGSGTITWSLAEGSSLPDGLNLSSDGTITGTPTAQGESTFTVKATNDYGSNSKSLSITIGTQTNVPVTGVSLNTSTLNLVENETDTLTATVEPSNATNKDVTWASSNNAVVTVDQNGNVEAVGAGTATITVTAQGDSTKSASCTVTVTASTVPVTGVSLNKDSLALGVGDSETLTATVKPEDATNKAVTWTSSNSTVATVDQNGVVTAVAPGTATITVTTADGGFTATCTVTVRPDVPPANPNYRITVEATQGGTVTADPTAAKAGATVTLTPDPDAGYQVGAVAVTDRFGDAVAVTEQADGTYTFTMPNGQVTVTVTFAEAPLPFPDVTEGDWFYDAVRCAYETGLMDGVGDNLFAPNSETTRAQLVTILYRLAGQPEPGGDSGFSDVETGTWYTDAVAWAAENGIVNGVSDTEFAPGDDITREQLAAILYRYAAYQGYDVSQRADLSGFGDASSISGYAQEALSWAHAQGLVLGFEDGSLRPQGTASRAQIAAVLMRFLAAVPTA